MMTVIKASLRLKLKMVLGILIAIILALPGCNRNSGVKIERNSVKVMQGRYTGETINLAFYAELTDTVSPIGGVYWSKADGRFHHETQVDSVHFLYEVFNPFGERELKTMSNQVGRSKTVRLPLPVFSTPEKPYEYTLRVTFYYGGQKYDTYSAKFRLTHPEAQSLPSQLNTGK